MKHILTRNCSTHKM